MIFNLSPASNQRSSQHPTHTCSVFITVSLHFINPSGPTYHTKHSHHGPWWERFFPWLSQHTVTADNPFTEPKSTLHELSWINKQHFSSVSLLASLSCKLVMPFYLPLWFSFTTCMAPCYSYVSICCNLNIKRTSYEESCSALPVDTGALNAEGDA